MIAGSRLISLAAALPWRRTGYDYALFSFSMVHITDCRVVVEFRDHNLSKCTVYATFLKSIFLEACYYKSIL